VIGALGEEVVLTVVVFQLAIVALSAKEKLTGV
jgi:hypothetical protein